MPESLPEYMHLYPPYACKSSLKSPLRSPSPKPAPTNLISVADVYCQIWIQQIMILKACYEFCNRETPLENFLWTRISTLVSLHSFPFGAIFKPFVPSISTEFRGVSTIDVEFEALVLNAHIVLQMSKKWAPRLILPDVFQSTQEHVCVTNYLSKGSG